jgi:sulfatase maturation enzyme AslB (radical SAM superfamily)
MLNPKEFIKNVEEILETESPKQKVNVLYMNTNCNLRCDYCYEIDSRGNLDRDVTIKGEAAQAFFDEIAEREKGLVSTVVIMGGEVFLNYAFLLEILRYAESKPHQYAISITTNGTLLHRYTKNHLHEIRKRIVTLEVSWDGSGQDRRVDKAGISSRIQVEQNLAYLRSIDIDYKISYTVHRDNYKKLLYDMVYILEKLKPNAIKLSFACQELSDLGVDFEKFKSDFQEYAEQLFLSYQVPICDLSCGSCGMCDKSNFSGNHYISPTKGEIYKDSTTNEPFNSF